MSSLFVKKKDLERERYNMDKRVLKEDLLQNYLKYLISEEKSRATLQKYACDIRKFYVFSIKDVYITKDTVMAFKTYLQKKYKVSSVNSMLVALNSFFKFLGWHECRVKSLRIQRRVFLSKNEELNEKDYDRLLKAAKSKSNERLALLMQSICSTGIRVSEHRFITAESLNVGYMTITNKGKTRDIYYPEKLLILLKKYCHRHRIQTGSIFCTRNGKPIDRSNIWRMMRSLCEYAEVPSSKVFPHNFRHLFAVTYYSMEKDIIHLADILGHSSIETTRSYVRSRADECQRIFNKMELVRLKI